jgi:hypothetical protein
MNDLWLTQPLPSSSQNGESQKMKICWVQRRKKFLSLLPLVYSKLERLSLTVISSQVYWYFSLPLLKDIVREKRSSLFRSLTKKFYQIVHWLSEVPFVLRMLFGQPLTLNFCLTRQDLRHKTLMGQGHLLRRSKLVCFSITVTFVLVK